MLNAQKKIQRLHECQDLVALFNEQFLEAYNTQLVGGYSEPFYKASQDSTSPNLLCFREDYFASALHEIAHWCIAGEVRRQQDDFGYWYEPEGRSQTQQMNFFKVEVKPQALEKIFSQACGFEFKVSVDDFDKAFPQQAIEQFKADVDEQQQQYLSQGLPARAKQFCIALQNFYQSAQQ